MTKKLPTKLLIKIHKLDTKIHFALCGSHPPSKINKKEVRTKVQPLFLKLGQGWIRTTVPSREQIYSLSPLATRPPTHINFSKLPLTRFELVASPLPRECATPAPQRHISETTHPLWSATSHKRYSIFYSAESLRHKGKCHKGCKRTSLIKKAGNRNRTYNLRFTKPLLYR